MGRDAEVREFNLSRLRQEHIRRFDITMDLSLSVKVIESQEQLVADDCDVSFIENPGFKLQASAPKIQHRTRLSNYQIQAGSAT